MSDAPKPTVEDVSRGLAWVLGHRKTVWLGVLVLFAFTSSGATYIYQRQRAADEVAALSSEVAKHGTAIRETDRRLTIVEQDGVERRADLRALAAQLKTLEDGQRRIEQLLDQLLLRFTPLTYGADHARRIDRRSGASGDRNQATRAAAGGE